MAAGAFVIPRASFWEISSSALPSILPRWFLFRARTPRVPLRFRPRLVFISCFLVQLFRMPKTPKLTVPSTPKGRSARAVKAVNKVGGFLVSSSLAFR